MGHSLGVAGEAYTELCKTASLSSTGEDCQQLKSTMKVLVVVLVTVLAMTCVVASADPTADMEERNALSVLEEVQRKLSAQPLAKRCICGGKCTFWTFNGKNCCGGCECGCEG